MGYANYQGDIAEIIVYNRSLSADDQTNLQAYLQNKWLTGLSAATTQPFSVAAPVYIPWFGSMAVIKGNGLTAITFTGSNGPASGMYRILSATNLAASLGQWVPVATNYFDAGGGFSNTVPVDPLPASRFYRVIQP